MNFFYGINNSEFYSELQIPAFKNRQPKAGNVKLFRAFPGNNKWIIEEVEKEITEDFFLLGKQEIKNNYIFFLAKQEDLNNYDYKKLINFCNFTDTSPAYRANFKIFLNNQKSGYSSYQSEYPFEMTIKKGTILSAVSSIANKNAEKNYIFIRNIFLEPVNENFKAYLVNINLKKIEDEFDIKTNFTNSFKLNNQLIKPEIFLVTKQYLGIPMFVSVNKRHISFEHTHPPHEYILSHNKFKKISELKKEVNEIIN
jgi:hypothetical protein